MKPKVQVQFTQFYDKWLTQLQHLLTQLPPNPTDQHLQSLVTKLTHHFKEYYTVKWALAVEDVLPFYHPSWTTPLENAYSWVTGWKPSSIFKVSPSLPGLTQDQLRMIEQLRTKMRVEQAKVEMEMERQQMGLADRKMVELARLGFRVKTGDQANQIQDMVEVALKGVLCGLVKVMKAADCVRLRTMKGTLDVLNPLQSVKFLAMVAMLHIQFRPSGKKLDSIRHL